MSNSRFPIAGGGAGPHCPPQEANYDGKISAKTQISSLIKFVLNYIPFQVTTPYAYVKLMHTFIIHTVE